MIAATLVKLLTIFSIVFALLLEVVLEPFLRWFTPDLFFIALLAQTLVWRRLDFVSLFFVCLFYDIFTDNVFGATVLTVAIVFYFIELSGFHNLRFSLFGSTAIIAVFYYIYLATQQVISFGIEGLTDYNNLYLLFGLPTTLLVWMLGWKFQLRRNPDP